MPDVVRGCEFHSMQVSSVAVVKKHGLFFTFESRRIASKTIINKLEEKSTETLNGIVVDNLVTFGASRFGRRTAATTINSSSIERQSNFHFC